MKKYRKKGKLRNLICLHKNTLMSKSRKFFDLNIDKLI